MVAAEMRCRGYSFALLGIALPLFPVPRSLAQAASPGLVSVRAELTRSLRSGGAKVGDSFFLKTAEAWQRPGCSVPQGTSLLGKVVSSASSATAARVVLSLQFAVMPCAETDVVTLQPVLVALQAHDPVEDSALRRMSSAGLEDRAIASMFTPARPGMPTSSDTMLTSANSLSVTSSLGFGKEANPLKTGDVVGIRGVHLQLPEGTAVTSLLSSHEILLGGERTTFVMALVDAPAPVASDSKDGKSPEQPGTASAIEAGARVARPAAEDIPAREQEVCASSGCQQIASVSGDTASDLLWSVPITKLGFQSRPDRSITALGDSTGVHFLGEDQLLVTFPLHTLIERPEGQTTWTTKPRKIRAVLFSKSSGQVLLVQDWLVPENTGSYLWSFGAGHLLAHVGNELLLLGPGLVVEQRMSLTEPLLFLSAAPQGELILMATVHEKHSPEVHADLSKLLGTGETLDENYHLTAIDAHLRPIGSRLLYAEPTQPAIFRSAMITTTQVHGGRWELDQTRWSGERSTLAHLQSACPVQVTSLPGNLLLARGCTPNEAASRWYRVLNEAGATLLKGSTDRYNLLQQAGTDLSGSILAIAFGTTESAIDFRLPVRSAVFTGIRLQAYYAHTGRSFFAKHLPVASPEQDLFSLSAWGDTLAVLTAGSLQAYKLPRLPPLPVPASRP